MKKMKIILSSISEREREEIIKTFDTCIKAICCEDISWQEFFVYESSEEMMKKMLLSKEAQYIMVICDQVKCIREEEKEGRTVKICITENKKEEEVQCIKGNENTLLAVITLSTRSKKRLNRKAKDENLKENS